MGRFGSGGMEVARGGGGVRWRKKANKIFHYLRFIFHGLVPYKRASERMQWRGQELKIEKEENIRKFMFALTLSPLVTSQQTQNHNFKSLCTLQLLLYQKSLLSAMNSVEAFTFDFDFRKVGMNPFL